MRAVFPINEALSKPFGPFLLKEKEYSLTVLRVAWAILQCNLLSGKGAYVIAVASSKYEAFLLDLGADEFYDQTADLSPFNSLLFSKTVGSASEFIFL
jgi:hypothetical protein